MTMVSLARFTKTALPALAVAVVSAGLLAGCFHRGPWHRGPGSADQLEEGANRHLARFMDKIDATDQQRAQIQASSDRLMPDVKKLFAERGKARDAVLEQWKADKPDTQALKALIDQQTEEFRAFAKKAVDETFAVRESLTPEQRAKIAAWMEKGRGRCGPGWGPGHGPGWGHGCGPRCR
jgi:Spy/CpxP family protein refolding chaperone